MHKKHLTRKTLEDVNLNERRLASLYGPSENELEAPLRVAISNPSPADWLRGIAAVVVVAGPAAATGSSCTEMIVFNFESSVAQ